MQKRCRCQISYMMVSVEFGTRILGLRKEGGMDGWNLGGHEWKFLDVSCERKMWKEIGYYFHGLHLALSLATVHVIRIYTVAPSSSGFASYLAIDRRGV